MTDHSQATSDQFSRAISRHVAGLQIEVRQPGGPPKFAIYSATIAAMSQATYLLTAGHVIRDIEAIQESYSECKCCATVGYHSQSSLKQFSLYIDDKFSFCDSVNGLPTNGIDVGAIPIAATVEELVSAGSHPWPNTEYLDPDTDRFDRYLICGFPAELSKPQVSVDVHGVTELRSVGLQFLWVSQHSEESNADALECSWLKLSVPATESGQSIPKSIRGMSGGPVLGFREDEPERCWLAGLQSWWNRDLRTAYVCKTKIVGEHILLGIVGSSDKREQFRQLPSGIFVPKN